MKIKEDLMNDDMIIQLYWNRVPDAIAQTQSKYGRPLMQIYLRKVVI